jgi:hypothetical protein
MNTNTTARRRRFSGRAATIATTAAFIFGAAACGTDTGSDNGRQPAAPAAPAAEAQSTPPPAISADSAERQGAAAQKRTQSTEPPARGYRPTPIP